MVSIQKGCWLANADASGVGVRHNRGLHGGFKLEKRGLKLLMDAHKHLGVDQC